MKRICSWCKKSLGDVPGTDDEGLVTHGICPDCAAKLFSQMGEDLQKFLDRFGVPIVVVDAEGRVTSSNRSAREALGKDVDAVHGKPGGDVFECVYAHLPEGCGHTMHCSGCAIRRAVMETHETGVPIRNRPAYLNQATPDGPHRVDLLISTERVGETVVLRIDEMRPG